MKIHVISKDSHNIRLCLPTGLIFNRLTASIIREALREHLKTEEGQELNTQAVMDLIFALKNWRRDHGPLTLIDVDSVNGDKVLITI
jgi:hypothetical protein